MLPWRNWFHCSGSTYGTWLRGDPRGWRSRHHREHVDTYEILKRIARHFVGIAKKNGARALSDAGLVAPDGVWALRGSIRPIQDRQHQLNVVRYIRGHAAEGAAVWSRVAAAADSP